MKKIFYKAFIFLSVFAFLSSCTNSVNTTSFVPQESQEVNDTTGLQSPGVKNYEQLYTSMSILTGIDPAATGNTSIRDFYDQSKMGLPSSNDISALQGSQLSVVMNLGAKFCSHLINTSALRTAFFSNSSFNSSNFGNERLTTLLASAALRRELVEFYFNKFWGAEVVATTARQEAIASVLNLTDDLIVDYTDTNQNLVAVMKAICVTVLVSGPNIFM